MLGVIAANIPDVDAFLYLGADSATAVWFRRGWTHGILALAVWTGLLAMLFAWVARLRPREVLEAPTRVFRARDFALLAGIAVASHPLLDWMNTYGVRFLMPFSDRWFYGDTLFIVDLVLVASLAAGWAASRWKLSRRHPHSAIPARIAIAFCLAYIVSMKAMSEITRASAVRAYALAEPDARALMVAPQPLTWLSRDLLMSDGQFYRRRTWYWTMLHADSVSSTGGASSPTGATPELIEAVRATVDGARFLTWSRFPYFVPDPATGTVFVGDLRYSSGTTESWAGIRVPLEHPGALAAR